VRQHGVLYLVIVRAAFQPAASTLTYFRFRGPVHRKLDHAFIQREERKVLANTNTLTGVKAGATLAYDDAARLNTLAAECLNAKAFRL
jgi:hypothetical protein